VRRTTLYLVVFASSSLVLFRDFAELCRDRFNNQEPGRRSDRCALLRETGTRKRLRGSARSGEKYLAGDVSRLDVKSSTEIPPCELYNIGPRKMCTAGI